MKAIGQLGELTSWVSAQTVDDLATWPFDTAMGPVPERLGRYRIAGLIGTGGMGAVYRGNAEGFADPVAIKTLRKLSPVGLLGLKQEFRRTRALSHSNLVTLYELGQDSGTWYFSMELVSGRSLLHHVWEGVKFPGATVASERLMRLVPQLLDAVSYLHQNGVLHLDIKPSNILVTPAGIAKLLDFGLSEAEFTSDKPEAAGAFAGTPAYMAPEQLWGKHSKACDAYALGVTFFEAVAGQLPLAAQLETLLTKQTKAAPRVRDINPGVPERLANVIDALLERNPDNRLGIEEAGARLGVGTSVPTSAPVSPSVELVGREAEVEHLVRWLAASSDEVVVGTLSGESGVGKTRLLEAARHSWRAAGAWVLSSRCFEWQSIAFKAVDAIIDGLFERLRLNAESHELPPDLSLATSTFPVLAGLPLEPASGRPTDKQLERDRALNAIAQLVGDLAQRQPIVLCIDDAQWGDVESAELLSRCAEKAGRHLLIVLGSRPEGKTQDFYQRLSQARARREELTLEPLTYSQSYSLARQLAPEGQWTDEELRSIAQDAGGVPLFVEQVARYSQPDGLRPKTLAGVVELQFHRLPRPARQLLEVIVVDEHPTPIAAALLAAGHSSKDIHALALLQGQRFVRFEGLGDASLIEPYHDRVRQEVLRLIPVEAQQQLHEALAHALNQARSSPAHVAAHWFKAGRSRIAAWWAVKAAREAYAALAFERSAQWYTRALDWDSGALDATPELREEFAWALYHAGRCAAAGDAFVSASEVAPRQRKHLLQGHAIEALLVAGEVDRGQVVLGKLLPRLGISRVWRGTWGIVQLFCLILRVRLKAYRLRIRSEPDPIALQRAEVTWAAGKAFTNLLPVDGVVHLLRSLLFALQSGDEIAIARGLNIAASGYVPFLEAKSKKLMQAATHITENNPTAYLLGVRGVALATAATMYGDWREALRQIEEAGKHLEAAEIPTHWERAVLAVNRTASLEQLGQLRQIAPYFENTAKSAKQRGDMVGYISNWASVGFCRLAANDFAGLEEVIQDYAEVVGTWKVGYGIWHTALWHLKVLRALRQGDYAEARQLLEAEWPLIIGAQLHRTRALRLYLLETRAAVCLGQRPEGVEQTRRWLREARRLRRYTERTNRLDAKPNALLLSAAVHHALGRQHECLADLVEAADQYSRASMQEREVTTRWRIAQLSLRPEEQARLEREAYDLGIVELETWARLRTPGFWPVFSSV